MTAARQVADLVGARHLRLGGVPHAAPRSGWDRTSLSGRLVEISGAGGSALLTAAFGLVLDAQQGGETTAWITTCESSFFPPDAAEGGVDLDALVVVRVPRADAVARAADKLVRSGAFGLVILDLVGGRPLVPVPLQARLLGLAQKHDTAVVFLTRKRQREPSLGSLVSLRGSARRTETAVRVHILKDKRRAPGWVHTEQCRGPAGLR